MGYTWEKPTRIPGRHPCTLSLSVTHPFNDSNPIHLWGETRGVAPRHTLEINMYYTGRLTKDKDNGCNEQTKNTQSMQNGSQIGFLVFKECKKRPIQKNIHSNIESNIQMKLWNQYENMKIKVLMWFHLNNSFA